MVKPSVDVAVRYSNNADRECECWMLSKTAEEAFRSLYKGRYNPKMKIWNFNLEISPFTNLNVVMVDDELQVLIIKRIADVVDC